MIKGIAGLAALLAVGILVNPASAGLVSVDASSAWVVEGLSPDQVELFLRGVEQFVADPAPQERDDEGAWLPSSGRPDWLDENGKILGLLFLHFGGEKDVPGRNDTDDGGTIPVTPVPEGPTILLFGAGLAGLLWKCRRY